MSSNGAVEAEEKLDPRIKRTRAMIEQAFLDVLQEKSFTSMSVQDITEKAGVNRTTFYLHFTDKYELVTYSMNWRFRQAVEGSMLDKGQLSPENLRALIMTLAGFVEMADSHCAVHEPQFEALMEAQVKQQVQAVLVQWLGKKDAMALRIATATSWAMYGLTAEWVKLKKRPKAEAFADEVAPLVMKILEFGQTA
jgi:AcrR family transcriptional regulator